MNLVKKLLTAVIALVMMLGMSIRAMAENHSVSTESTTHTYEIYQIFTGEVSGDQLVNLVYGTNAATGDLGDSVSATDMARLAEIEATEYENDQEKIKDLLPFVNLTNPVATIGKGHAPSASLQEGYYIIKDVDGSLEDPETYTLYLFKVLDEDLVITPKSGTTTVDKEVTGTNDSTGETTEHQNGADYDVGDSIPYAINITFAENVTDYKTYTVTLTDTLSEGLTPPAVGNISVTFKDKNGNAITEFGAPEVTVNGQVITVTYTIVGSENDETVAVGSLEGSEVLNGAVINITYEAVLNDKAKSGVEGNPNTYTITYSNNPNGNDTGETPDQDVKVYTFDLEIEKIDGNNEPLRGAEFTLYKLVTAEHAGAQTGADIKADLDENVDADLLEDDSYYVPVSMTEAIDPETGKVTHSVDTMIGSGQYVLIETTVPAGYNAYEGMEITVTATYDAEGKLTGLTATPDSLSIEADKLDVIVGEVENQSGSVLPETGGIGTTIFYTLGGMLVLCAGILLVSRRRMSE